MTSDDGSLTSLGGNETFARLIREANFSYAELARKVCDEVERATGSRPGVDSKAIGRMRRGEIKKPVDDTCGALLRIFHLNDVSELGFGSKKGAPPPGVPPAPVRSGDEDDDMKRREFVAGVAAVGAHAALGVRPAAADGGFDTRAIQRALLLPAGREVPAAKLGQELGHAQQLYRDGAYARLHRVVPVVLEHAQACDDADARTAAFVLATEHLLKIDEDHLARVAANQAWAAAAGSGSVRSRANAAWMMCVALRHGQLYDAACDITEHAANELAAEGLGDPVDLAAYGHLNLTLAYTAAAAGKAGAARDYYAEGLDVSRYFDGELIHDLWPFGPLQARLYGISVGHNLGDVGSALEHGKQVQLSALPTVERKERALVDMTRVHLLAGKKAAAAKAILTACQVSPGAAARVQVQKLARQAGLSSLPA